MTIPVQAELLRARPIRLSVGVVVGAGPDHSVAPTDGITDPDMTLAPDSTTGLRTTGFAFGFKSPLIGPPAGMPVGGFTVTIWFRSPVARSWFSFEPGLVVYDGLYLTFDVDACEIYFQIAGEASPGNVDVFAMEQ